MRSWKKLALDKPTAMKMIKFALPPTLALCIYQSDLISRTYSTVGYLIAIGAILSSGLAPRAAYIEATVCNVLFLSISAGTNVFACWTILKARQTTRSPGSAPNAYNSSASAVAGVWFFFLLYVISVRQGRKRFTVYHAKACPNGFLGCQICSTAIQVCLCNVCHSEHCLDDICTAIRIHGSCARPHATTLWGTDDRHRDHHGDIAMLLSNELPTNCLSGHRAIYHSAPCFA